MPLFDVSPTEIAGLNPYAFVDVMNRLLCAEADWLGILPSDVDRTLRITDPDGGVDAAVTAPDSLAKRWIPAGRSVWQFKTSDLDRSKKFRKEFNKPGVQEALEQGGSYCLIIGEKLGTIKAKNRRKWLNECLKGGGFGLEQGEVLSAPQIAQWASEHLAIAQLPYFHRPIGDLARFDEWAKQRIHQVPFCEDTERHKFIAAIRAIASSQNKLNHLRIEGRPGVGKTRLALEAFQAPGLQERVLYASNPDEVPQGLFAWIRANRHVKVILVVDECDGDHAHRLANQADTCGGRVVILTIGQGRALAVTTDFPEGIFPLEILSDQKIKEIVANVSPILTGEAIRFVARMASGYVKLATALASALARNPGLASAADLARSYDVQLVLSALLPDDNLRKGMKAVALLRRVGWEGEVAQEGQIVASFMGIRWAELQDIVGQMVREGLVAKQGRYRYVTPHILAVWLASEVWDDRGEAIIELIEQLPAPGRKAAFWERMADLGDHPQTKRVVEKLLTNGELFPDLESLDTHADVFGTLAKTDPKAGLRSLERCIGHLPRDALLSLRQGRRHVVRTLERLAWLPETFFGAARLLLALAEAENEEYGNNATGVWTGLFGTRLGDTAVPAIKRHRLIDEALDSASVERRLLAVRALNRALSVWESSIPFAAQQGGRVVPPRWQPKDLPEDHATRRSALKLLDRALNDSEHSVVQEARTVLLDSARALIRIGLADDVLPSIESLETANDEQRRQIRDTLQAILKFESKSLAESQKVHMQASIDQLVGTTFRDRLRRWVGEWSRADWLFAKDEGKGPEDWAATMAEEAYEDPDLLQKELDWLASPEARNIWFFARRLGELDGNHQWLPELFRRAKSGFGSILLAGYLRGRADAGETEWREAVLDQWAKEEPTLAWAVLEATWRGEPTDQGAHRLIELVSSGEIEPTQLGVLVFGNWTKSLTPNVFRGILGYLVGEEGSNATESALAMLLQRLEMHPEERDTLSALAWTLLKRRSALKGYGMIAWYWQQVAHFYVSQNPVRLAKMVLSLFDEPDQPSSMSDERIQVLEEATRGDPKGVWQEVAKILLRKDETSLGLRLVLEEGYITLFSPDYLLEWAEDHKPAGPRIVASLAWVGGSPLHRLPRQLLIRYGSDKTVGDALRENFLSGSWSGPMSAWLEGKLAQAREWTNDSHPFVRQWAGGLVQSIERNIQWAKQREEEWGF